MTSNRTIIGLFDSIPSAQQAIADLQRFGVSLELLTLITHEELSASEQSRTVGTGLAYDDLLASLREAQLSSDTSQNALATVRRGGALVSAMVAAHSADDVYQIMLRNGAVDYAHHAANHDARGDFARGLRETAVSSEHPDFARGMHAAPAADEPEDVRGDFARGMREQPINPAQPDYARGMHHEAFLNHYQRWMGNGGLPFDHYLPAYQFGYDLGNAPGSQHATWAEAEREARQSWDREARGSWEQFKQAIRFGWEKACGRV
jgi:hypothetical protein